MASWIPRMVKIQILRTSRGTGWAVGKVGVLTARHVIEALLVAEDGKPPDVTVEITLANAPERSFDCRVVWDDEQTDLALLAISDRKRTTWQTLLRRAPQPLLAYPGPGTSSDGEASSDVLVYGMPGTRPRARDTSSLAWMLADPEQIRGALSALDENSVGTVDLDGDSLPKEIRRYGMPGAAVLGTGPDAMLLGIVTARTRGRHKGRYRVTGLPHGQGDDTFREALETVGATGAVVSMDGPALQSYATAASFDVSLEPRRVREIDDPGFFGTRMPRDDYRSEAEPYGAWIPRPEQNALANAIDRALEGTEPRLIVLRGPSASGKSRLAYEVMRTHPGLADHRILCPLQACSILDMPQRLWPPRCVVWMDNLDHYPSNALSHEKTRQLLDSGARQLLASSPQVLIVATVADSPDHANAAPLVDSGAHPRSDAQLGSGYPMTSASLSGVQTVLDDESLTAAITVGTTVRGMNAAINAADARGLGLGEYLSGYRELADHYMGAGWPTRTMVDVVRDWDRSGVGEPIPPDVTRTLWQRLAPNHLPRAELTRFSQMSASEAAALWSSAVRYACEKVVGTASLLTSSRSGLRSTEFARMHIDQVAINPQVWDYLLTEHPTTRLQRLTLGIRALESGTPQRARRAFESVLAYRDNDVPDPATLPLMEVIARRGIALYHSRIGRDEQAIMVYTDLVDTFGDNPDADIAEQVAQALLGIGITFSNLASHGQAVSAYTELIDKYRDHPSPILDEYVAKALLGQATTLATLGRHDEEKAAYADILARYDGVTTPALAALVDVARSMMNDETEAH